MSEEASSINRVIYVELLDEGTFTWRPTCGVRIRKNVYRLLPVDNYDPTDEKWQFLPGSIVECELEDHRGERLFVAKRLSSDT